ncbi:Ser-Thr-rich glycosyl-phosphatidyl-inositol-anchored membrane family-domain-containing protein [Cunninghamella echinulata]|nr:Ser-Thr-rich glycosyl-phosphatidyl-inositol-anchored membrane family-domain-containing protein [Cunninghamella echinulata]
MKLTVIISSALVALASAQSSVVYVTSPAGGEKYTAGTDAVITWKDPTVESIGEINLTKGDSKSLQRVDTIANDITATDGEFTWSIPSDIEAGEYAFQFGTSPNFAYSGRFIVEAGERVKTGGNTEAGDSFEGGEVTEASEEGNEIEGEEEA